MINRSPIYNLSAVIRETGLQADVLRAWERRYGFPSPERTPGGHRLYSDYDIAVVKWLRARQAEGLSISRAVELWKDHSSQGRDPLSAGSAAAFPANPVGDASRSELLRNEWLTACLEFDVFKAENVLNQAFAIYPVETACFEILQKGLSEFGRLWFEGKSSAQQEHFATVLATRRVETLIAAMPGPTREQTLLVGCPAGEWHSFPALLLSLLLRRKGFNVVYLGANIPLEQIEQAAAAIRPALAVLTAQQLVTAPAMQAAAAAFQRLNLPVAYGGLIFNRIPELRAKIPAYFLGEDLPAAVERVEHLAAAPAGFPDILPIEKSYAQLAAAFRLKQSQIEETLAGLLANADLPAGQISQVNAYFAGGLTAALELGDLAYLEPDLEWVKQLLSERGLPADTIKTYLDLYQQAVRLEMGSTGALIAGWVSTYLARNGQ